MLQNINGVLYTISDKGDAISCIGKYAKEVKLSSTSVSLQDYLGNPLPYEPISIRITGETAFGETLEPYEGICDDGIIELDEYETGDKLTIQTLNENVENATLEVVI